jgi:archaetidylinositol phosphate synthase
MLGGDLRAIFSKYMDMIGGVIGKTGINPNLFSLLALPIAGIAAYFLSRKEFLIGMIFVFFAMIWDALDGGVARTQKKASKFGNYLDALLDRFIEIIIYLGIALAGYYLESFLVITGSLVLSYAKPRTALLVKIDNHDWPAIGERVDRLILLFIGLVLRIIIPSFRVGDYIVYTFSVILYLIAAVVYIGSIQRIFYAKKIIDAGGTDKIKVKYRR